MTDTDKPLSGLPSIGTLDQADTGDEIYVLHGANSRRGSLGGLAGASKAFARVGVGGAAADDTNRLSVNSPAVLFNHDGAGSQVKVNKAAAGDTASHLFQVGFSTRAEIGLVENDDFVVKVSADGSAFVDAIRVDHETGRVALPLTDVVNVADYRAITVDDTAAVEAAFAALGSSSGAVYFPAGIYTLDSDTLAVTLASAQSITIYGDGADATTFYFPNDGNGLSVTFSANQFAWIGGNSLIIEDIGFVTNVQNSGKAIAIDGNSQIGDPSRPTFVSRCGFRGTLNNDSYWTYGVHITDLQNAIVTDCYYFSYTLGLLGTAVAYVGTSGSEHPTVLNVHNLNMQFGNVGVECSGTIEGLNVSQSNFTQVNYGVHWDSAAAAPQCSVTNSQINAAEVGINLIDATASQITGNLIFTSDDGVAIAGNPVYATITGNTMVGLDAGSGNGIILQSGATDNTISGNVFKGFATNIWLQSGANNNVVGVNRYADGTPLLDQATGNHALVHGSGLLTANDGIRSSHPTSGNGYATGAGGAVTQATNKSTGVTLDKVTGQITMNNEALANNASAIFTLTNSTIGGNDTVDVTHASGGGTVNNYVIVPLTVAAGSVGIRVTNISGVSRSEAVKINFNVHKGAAS